MKKIFALFGLLAFLFTNTVLAEEKVYVKKEKIVIEADDDEPEVEGMRYVFSARGGIDYAKVGGTTQEAYMVPPAFGMPNQYYPVEKWRVAGVWSALIGVELPIFRPGNRWQTGVSYYQGYYRVEGNVAEQSEFDEVDLSYEYKVQNQRVLWENRWLTALNDWFDFFVLVGIGWSHNKAYDYTEESIDPSALTNPPFTEGEENSFTYAVGLGFEASITDNIRLGVGYQYSDLGEVRLGDSSFQQTDSEFSFDTTPAHEFLGSITYLY